jgi:flagellar hook-associated protein 2
MAIAQFSGLASGIDSASLIDAVIEAKQIKNDLRKKQVEEITAESESLDEFKSKITALSDIIDKFRTINGGGVSKKATTTNSDAVTATASAAATNGSYSINVVSVADTATSSFNQSYSSDTSVASTLGGDVTVTVGLGAEQVVITKTATAGVTTLNDLVTAFNADSNATGRVTASAINIGTDASPDYRLVFKSLVSGTDEGTLALSGTTAELTAVASTTDQATDSEFNLGGIGTSIIRSSASISDVIPGVTFNLVDAGAATITVSNDAETTADNIQEFVDAYNEIVKYYNENNTVERTQDGSKIVNVFGTLAKARTDNDFISAFRLDMAGATSTNGTSISSMADLGLLTNRDGTLTFDKESTVDIVIGFNDAVEADPVGVTEVLNSFADALAGVDGTIYQYTKLGGQIDIAIDSNDGEIENISNAIAQLDRQTDKIRESLTLRFARLESTTSRLQSQQQSLTSALAALG